jgi:Uma2 family endonuclease
MTPSAPLPRLSADAFLDWAAAQPSGRYELVAGEVVAMAPERVAHADTKALVWLALRTAAAGRPCHVHIDGVSVRVDDRTVYEPDVLVRCGAPTPGDAVAVDDPVILVEVVSPGSRAVDTGQKLADYFRLPSLRHYLVVTLDPRAVIHHRRGEDGRIDTAILHRGVLSLDPPGLAVGVEALFAPG